MITYSQFEFSLLQSKYIIFFSSLLSCSKLAINRFIKKGVIDFHLRAMSTAPKYLVDDPKYSFLKDLGLNTTNAGAYNGKWFGSGPAVKSIDPATGNVIAEVQTGTAQDYEECVKASIEAYKFWSNVPAPQRGEIVRQIGEELRKYLQPLGKLVSLGMNMKRIYKN